MKTISEMRRDRRSEQAGRVAVAAIKIGLALIATLAVLHIVGRAIEKAAYDASCRDADAAHHLRTCMYSTREREGM